MLKFTAAFLVLVVACNAFPAIPGGYTNRPDLVDSDVVKSLTVYAAKVLATTQNLFLANLRVIKVQVQVVNGLNYKIDFSAETVYDESDRKTTCQVVVNVRPDSIKDLIQSQCQTS
ncbi:unnamed protein product [Rotaria sp. Silwood2]|nr:unnamed protein product [Rotaria sp. Silwood2]CAF2553349.1 unnamed protein product [Rotaria sp. Silwood2]CAF2804024.1 unnamed protein product [Rotaria sp. Silwood2]CAF2961116.1 unnamed protein product [Rotaria sp. Silwood2]CAF3982681.1 unnamed protein product [Rotaria sp. Silwood2]